MKLIAGLGNPGPQYALTRHNVGFICIDAIKENFGFPAFKEKNYGASSEGTIQGQKVLLFKPLNFMNRSGPPLQKIKDFYKISGEDTFVFHDDLDLAPGKVRVKFAGGAGGHNGLKSLDQHIGPDYWRVKIGIGRPIHPNQDPAHYVLERFDQHDEKWLVPLLQETSYYVDLLFGEDPNKFTAEVMQEMKKQV